MGFCFCVFHHGKGIQNKAVQNKHCPFAQISIVLMKVNQIIDCLSNAIIKIDEIVIDKLKDVDWRIDIPVKKHPAQN